MRRLILLILLLLSPLPAVAQNAANLIADRVEITSDRRLIASGNVEVIFEGTRLSAARIIYSQATDRLLIEGPIFITGPDGTILTAESADLDPRLESGLLIGARMVLDRRLQMAADQIARAEGRYTQLDRVAATSCTVCGNEAPLWDIRAARVVHDQEARQLYFTDAVLRVRGLPIVWLPRLRMPDPSLDRATGLLLPYFRSTDVLGLGVKTPYFIRLGDHRDLTLTPYISTQTTTLEARYRQAFLRGDFELTAAISSDQVLPGALRGYIFANGELLLRNDFVLEFGLNVASDDAYLLDYGYSDADRLESGFALSRYRDTDAFWSDLTVYQGFLATTINESNPPIVANAHFERHFEPALVGGTLTLSTEVEAHVRPYTSVDPELTRDVMRFALGSDWENRWIVGPGLVIEGSAGILADVYATIDDPANDGVVGRLIPSGKVSLRWPLAGTTALGGTDIVTPIVSFGWSEVLGGTPVNEDSTRVELHEANLFDLSYFPGEDAQETGPMMAAGGMWSHTGPNGWNMHLTFGRILRRDDLTAFSESSGLSRTVSDWLLATQLNFPSGLSVDGRTLLDDSFVPAKSAARMQWATDSVALAASYVWLDADLDEARPSAVSEWTFDGDYQINDTWGIGLGGRYDMVTLSPTEASAVVRWRNECLEVELSASRRFTSSITVQPSTDLGLRIGLNGFSTGRSGVVSERSCTN